MANQVQLVLNAHSVLGEGAIWDAKRKILYWVDIDPGLVHIYDPANAKDRCVSIGQPVGTVVSRESGGLVLAVRDGFMSLDADTGKTSILATPRDHNPQNRFNDGKCDPAGRFWAGTMEIPTRKGALFRLDADHSIREMVKDIGCSNGITWSLDKRTMYYIDSYAMRIDAFEYDNGTGSISNRHTIIRVPDSYGMPDGMTMDSEEKLWVAHWDGWSVCRWEPSTGRLLQKVDLPVARPTSCAFGGPELDTLYITSATTELSEASLAKQPSAGGLFSFYPGVRGLPAFSFKG